MGIKASMREKERYILFLGDKSNVESEISAFLGILGKSELNPRFISKNGKDILIINNKGLNKLRAVFELSKLDIKIKKVSGTIKGVLNEK